MVEAAELALTGFSGRAGKVTATEATDQVGFCDVHLKCIQTDLLPTAPRLLDVRAPRAAATLHCNSLCTAFEPHTPSLWWFSFLCVACGYLDDNCCQGRGAVEACCYQTSNRLCLPQVCNMIQQVPPTAIEPCHMIR